MDAITMQPIRELIPKLQGDFPGITFVSDTDFRWSASTSCIYYDSRETNVLFLLHEVGHAMLQHNDFKLDIELIAQEREAWSKVRNELGPTYGIKLDEELIESALDTYREWLDARSRCPTCSSTGLQTKTSTYVCVNCRCSWHPNDARQCALRRYIVAT